MPRLWTCFDQCPLCRPRPLLLSNLPRSCGGEKGSVPAACFQNMRVALCRMSDVLGFMPTLGVKCQCPLSPPRSPSVPSVCTPDLSGPAAGGAEWQVPAGGCRHRRTLRVHEPHPGARAVCSWERALGFEGWCFTESLPEARSWSLLGPGFSYQLQLLG